MNKDYHQANIVDLLMRCLASNIHHIDALKWEIQLHPGHSYIIRPQTTSNNKPNWKDGRPNRHPSPCKCDGEGVRYPHYPKVGMVWAPTAPRNALQVCVGCNWKPIWQEISPHQTFYQPNTGIPPTSDAPAAHCPKFHHWNEFLFRLSHHHKPTTAAPPHKRIVKSWNYFPSVSPTNPTFVIHYHIHQWDGHFWNVPNKFKFPDNCKRKWVWEIWLTGIPDYQTEDIHSSPIIPLCLINPKFQVQNLLA